MSVYLYHEQPDLADYETDVTASRPGEIQLEQSALHPGGGGQESDQAEIEYAGGRCRVIGVREEAGQYWHVLDTQQDIGAGRVHVRIDEARRSVLAQLHTATHIMNALVFRQFEGALVTGAQINADGTARMDFDLPEVDNDLLRAIEPQINDVIRQALPVRALYVPAIEAQQTSGLIRSMSVAPPPTDDGRLRIIEIADLDRQACGGTHLTNTGQCRAIRLMKIENKGRHNRRMRIGLV